MLNDVVISVVVVTYNSSKYVIDTLESIKSQTYNSIELVISDDCSTDNTVEIVREWINKNKSRFKIYKIIESMINTGITENLNRGIRKTEGEYIKPIAGDDMLLPNCIEDLLRYILDNNLEFAYSKAVHFPSYSNNIDILNYKFFHNRMLMFFSLDKNKQYRELLKGFPIDTTGLFLNKQFITNLGGFNTKYEMMDDYPFALKVSSMGYKLNLLNEFTVLYRVRKDDRNTNFIKSKRKTLHIKNRIDFEHDEIFPRLKKEKMYITIYNLYIRRISEYIDNLGSLQIFSIMSRIMGYLSTNKIKIKLEILAFRIKTINIPCKWWG